MAGSPEDLALALELAEVADSITLGRFGAAALTVECKPDATPVTEADTAAERVLRDRLASARPGDGVVGEEYGEPEGSGGAQRGALEERRWIVDPIDGTKNYIRGIPVWATLLALQQGPELSVAVVSAPALQRRWWASRGAGAFMQDGRGQAPRRLGVSAVAELSDAELSFGGLEDWEQIGRLEAVLSLARACRRTRGFGDFWGYMLVAQGAVEIALDPVVSLWDLAAPLLIVEEAGGRLTDLAGVRTPSGGDALATNSRMHEAALSVIGR